MSWKPFKKIQTKKAVTNYERSTKRIGYLSRFINSDYEGKSYKNNDMTFIFIVMF